MALFLVAHGESSRSKSVPLSASAKEMINRIAPGIAIETFDELVERFRKMENVHRYVAYYLDHYAARVYSRRGKNFSKVGLDKEASQMAKRSVELLKPLLNQLQPNEFPRALFNEPDLTWVRQTPEFADSDIIMPSHGN